MSVATVSTVNTMGVRRLMSGTQRSYRSSRPNLSGYAVVRGMGALGDDTSDAASTLVAAGYNPLDVQQLVAQGATAQQLYNLPYGPGTSPADMSEGVGVLNSQLTGSFRAGTPMQYDPLGFAYEGGMASLGPAGSLVANAPPGTTSSALEFAAGPIGSIATPGPPTSGGAPSSPSAVSTALTNLGLTSAAPAAPAATLTQWIEQNWLWIALIAGAAIVVPPFIKKL